MPSLKIVHPSYRASAVGVYRLWRDSGYAVGGLLAGVLADLLGIPWAIGVVGALTFLSGLVAAIFLQETLANRMPNLERRNAFPRRKNHDW